MPPQPPFQIEIVIDVVCPWCHIGLRRLDAAIALVKRQYPAFECEKRWRPFFLDPDTPPEGEPYLPLLLQKFGGQEKVEAIFQRVRDAGATCGLAFHFEKILLRANTRHAHRLILWAQQRGDAQPLVERLFVAQFQRGENIGDRTALAGIAAECGYEREAVAAYLDSELSVDLVDGLIAEARAWGVNSVPTFVFDRRLGIPGAEDPAALAAAIAKVAFPRT